jgi:hypothetical protein
VVCCGFGFFFIIKVFSSFLYDFFLIICSLSMYLISTFVNFPVFLLLINIFIPCGVRKDLPWKLFLCLLCVVTVWCIWRMFWIQNVYCALLYGVFYMFVRSSWFIVLFKPLCFINLLSRHSVPCWKWLLKSSQVSTIVEHFLPLFYSYLTQILWCIYIIHWCLVHKHLQWLTVIDELTHLSVYIVFCLLKQFLT